MTISHEALDAALQIGARGEFVDDVDVKNLKGKILKLIEKDCDLYDDDEVLPVKERAIQAYLDIYPRDKNMKRKLGRAKKRISEMPEIFDGANMESMLVYASDLSNPQYEDLEGACAIVRKYVEFENSYAVEIIAL